MILVGGLFFFCLPLKLVDVSMSIRVESGTTRHLSLPFILKSRRASDHSISEAIGIPFLSDVHEEVDFSTSFLAVFDHAPGLQRRDGQHHAAASVEGTYVRPHQTGKAGWSYPPT